MRIISEFKDYYDISMGQGQDQTIVYLRTIQENSLTKQEISKDGYFPSYKTITGHINSRYYNHSRLYIKSFYIGFCGKIHPVLKLDDFNHEDKTFCFSLEDVENYVTNNFPQKELDFFFTKKPSTRKIYWSNSERHHSFKQFFDNKSLDYSQYFEKSPIFVVSFDNNTDIGTITFNGMLKDFDFVRKFPPFQAFQELSMWMGNQAAPIKEIPHIADEIMLEAKGFDKKWSFRKEPKNHDN